MDWMWTEKLKLNPEKVVNKRINPGTEVWSVPDAEAFLLKEEVILY